MKNKLLILLVAIVGIIAVVWGYIAANRKSDGKNIVVGVVLDLSGDGAVWGKSARDGIEVAHKYLSGNAEHKIRIIYEDSKGNQAGAINAFNKLALINKVVAVIGDTGSANTLAMAPLANNKHIPLISVLGSSPDITHSGEYVYRVFPSDAYEGEKSAEWARKNEYKNVAIIYPNDDYGKGLANAFEEVFVTNGGEVVAIEGYSTEEKNYRNMLEKVRASQADLIYLIGFSEATALLVKQIRELGLTADIFGSSPTMSDDFINTAGIACEGMYSGSVISFDESNPSEIQNMFIHHLREQFDRTADFANIHAADAFLVISECVAHGSITGEEIKDFIDKQRSFSGVNNISFDENGDVTNKTIAIKVIKDGKFILKESL